MTVVEGTRAERRCIWNFTITDDGWGWTCTRPSGSVERSPRAFTSLKEAGDDAATHGYGEWKGPERRAVAVDKF